MVNIDPTEPKEKPHVDKELPIADFSALVRLGIFFGNLIFWIIVILWIRSCI